TLFSLCSTNWSAALSITRLLIRPLPRNHRLHWLPRLSTPVRRARRPLRPQLQDTNGFGRHERLRGQAGQAEPRQLGRHREIQIR
ncbi:hypothetical protein PMAYCL1PPCAC_10156, partial [Pristionchus mayeri]